MEYCSRCVYPENTKPTIIFDDEGICSGCRYHDSRFTIDWDERGKWLKELLEEYKAKARETGNPYDCIIPVSGGKDSHWQTYLVKEVYGMNPLLVTYNHCFNTQLGLRNLNNLVKKLGCDLIRFTANLNSVRKISRYMVKKVGDLTWHYHAGIMTFPFQVAVRYKIPLIVWGEGTFGEQTGLVRLEDMHEFTKWSRQEHSMRGFEPEDLIDEESGLTMQDLAPYVYPTDEEIEELDARGIYLCNYLYWDARAQAIEMIEKLDFDIYRGKRDRTFCLYAKTDDHANDIHDYMKYLKFGYGRATDDACIEIRHGRMTREDAIDLVSKYDNVRPRTMDTYLDFMDMTEEEFLNALKPMRDPEIWKKDANGVWVVKDSVANHRNSPQVESARVPLVAEDDRTFGQNNRHLYYSDNHLPLPKSDDTYTSRGGDDGVFSIL
jgi:N-acetyl sugar amidotransferase